MSEYGDYDISVLKIDPHELSSEGDVLLSLANEMADSATRIFDAFAGLRLGWVSESADEAQAFEAHTDQVMKQMFGENGVLAAIVGGVKGVSIGFSNLEIALEKAFLEFSTGLAAPGSGSGPTDQMGTDFPINQDFPN
ncbi:hypothetical protein [Streptomyces kaempferi]|uniref:Uncharacterized protein n=1 Tax=Streptomyces kaempferi TaxID=333725 RepID=A0ABW3XPY1_9ACTN